MSAAQHDGLQTAHTSKYVYGFWRPITAIQRAGEDLNDQTTADPSWAPLLASPPYPSHASNLTCIATAAARTLARVLRSDSVPFTLTWTGTGATPPPNATRSFTSFSQLAEESAVARVYGGIHFRFELTAARESCVKVADYVVDHHAERSPFGYFH
jgi:hypothetical protein